MELTVCLLTQNNEEIIEQTFHSIRSIHCNILVGDSQSTDKTRALCVANKGDVIDVDIGFDRGKAKNEILKHVKTKWVLFLEPGEIIIQGHDEILEAIEKDSASYSFQILQSNIISKDIRLWSGPSRLKFKRPVFESVSDLGSKYLDVMIYSKYLPDIHQKKAMLQKWSETRPTESDPVYYRSSILLAEGKIDDFISMAGHYLFLEKQGISVTMTKYHLAMIECYAKNNLASAFRHLVPCLAIRPTMAEFWCLLGDIYYKKADYEKAFIFYDNAIVLGSRRLKGDAWPMDINKYHDHPNKMKLSCREMIDKTVMYSN